MDIVLKIVLCYLVLGAAALASFESATGGRIRNRFSSASAETQIATMNASNAPIGKRTGIAILLLTTWLFWPAVFWGATEKWIGGTTMGRRNRERIERIKAGLDTPIAQLVKRNPLARRIATIAGRKQVVAELTKGSTEDMIGRVSEMSGAGVLPESVLARAIKRAAPREMDKAIKKFQCEGREVTVNSLCAEARSSPSFVQMCANAGITMDYFENLARERMAAHGITRNE